MDKFGIFNIISSLSSILSNNKTQDSSVEPPEKNDVVSDAEVIEIKEKPETKKLSPMQQSMLDAMRSHDEFIKRVKDRQNVKP